MKALQMYKRLDKVSAKIRPNGVRQFTLEELCRLYWRTDKRGLKRLTEGAPMFGSLLECFEREDAERVGQPVRSARKEYFVPVAISFRFVARFRSAG